MITDTDIAYLRTAVQLAEQALAAGNRPFGSLLAGADGEVLFRDHNHDADGARTRHPELAIAQWAEENLAPGDRKKSTVYTSGEHCPMCAAAHAWAGLGRIVFASSSVQLGGWLAEFGADPSPVAALKIAEIAPHLTVDGPVPELAEEVKELQRRYYVGL